MRLVVLSYLVPLLLAAALVVGVEPSSSPPPVSPPPPPPAATTLPGCPSKCGDVEIPYPFGIGAKCALSGFTVTCNQSTHPPRPYIQLIEDNEDEFDDVKEIVNISLEAGEARIFTIPASICYSSPDNSVSRGLLSLFREPFLISSTRNVFTAIGCDTMAFLSGWMKNYLTGCISSCKSLDKAAKDNDTCSGLGCCQTSLSPGLCCTRISLGDGTDNRAWNYSPCSYAFVAEKDWYSFSRDDLVGKSFSRKVAGGRTIPLVLDWAIRSNGSCRRTPEGRTLTAPACVSDNSTCIDVDVAREDGYRCKCSEGYQGNPYLLGGCTNIDECMLRKKDPKTYEQMYPCSSGTICRDTPGHYECVCKFGHIGDPKSERGCRPIFPGYATAIVVTVVFILVSTLLLCFLFKEHKKRVRRGFFDKNGGAILKGMDIRTFTEVELEKMTNHYSNLIGKGHFGEVFRGTMDGNQQVAVKRPILVQGKKKNQDGNGFTDEITFQLKHKHSNLVRLIGCCLEMPVPSLVFEYIPMGSLHDVLHGANKSCSSMLPLTKRLDIAIGSAEAVSYMHSHGDHKHVHGNIKSANILLDEDLSPKVSDSGSSKLLSIDMYVAADTDYVDPLYMKTELFTAKSDVYSFGIVLLELITRKTAKYDGNKSLPINFVRCCKRDGNGRRMYDTNGGCDAQSSQLYIECLDKIGQLAVRCLSEDEDERPNMAEVAEELKRVKSMATEGLGDSGTAQMEDEAVNQRAASSP